MKARPSLWASSTGYLFKQNTNLITNPHLNNQSTAKTQSLTIHSSFSFHTHSTLFTLKAIHPKATSNDQNEINQLDSHQRRQIQHIITEHYNAHTPLFVSTSRNIDHGPYLDTKQLESSYITERKPLKGVSEYLAYSMVRCIKGLIHTFFGKSM